MIHILGWFLLFSVSALMSTEIDSFTDRDPALIDSTFSMNEIMQGYFDKALQEANKEGSCEPRVIEEALAKSNGNLFWAQIEDDISRSVLIDKRRSAMKDSIYAGMSILDAPVLHLASLGFIIRVGGLLLGSDKFGHFMQQGYSYFKQIYYDRKKLYDALAWGEMTERTYLGLTPTCIYSYGDLVANYDGMRFWERVTGIGEARDKIPYFSCMNGRWIQTAKFDWRDYVNLAWDEAMNCNRYCTYDVHKDVKARIRGMELNCPIEPQRCEEMKEPYADLAYHLLSPKCS